MANENLLVILAYSTRQESKKPDWLHIAETIRNLCGPVNPAVYHTPSDDLSGPYVLGVFCVVESHTPLPEPSEVELHLVPFFGGTVDIRIYETFPPAAKILIPASRGKHYLVFNGMTPNDTAEEAFNDWYMDEHIPMLRLVPGWRASCRFRILSSSSTSPPRYLALHEWENRDAFATPEFKAATNTPWRTRVVVEQVCKKERHLLEYHGSMGELQGSESM
ncbi:hypothetical protein B0H11DRAFT_620967 [Mycena galericulata]|nr:hypothetical protein B0H11DRAFT_620967 [Mycena galericulata]